jgi:hypothetical protein
MKILNGGLGHRPSNDQLKHSDRFFVYIGIKLKKSGDHMSEKTMEWVFQGVGTTGAFFIITLLLNRFKLNNVGLFASKEEEIFMGRGLRSIRSLARYILLVFGVTVYFNFLTHIDTQKSQLINSYPFITNPNVSIAYHPISIFIFVVVTVMLCILILIPKFRKWYFKKCNLKKGQGKLGVPALLTISLLLGIAFYILFISFQYSHILNLILTNAKIKYGLSNVLPIMAVPYLKLEDILIIVLDVTFYIIFLTIAIKMWSLMYKKNIRVTIKLSNGEIFEEMYVLNPGAYENILIGDRENIILSKKKIMIPKQNIIYVELLSEESIFERTFPLYEKSPSIILSR